LFTETVGRKDRSAGQRDADRRQTSDDQYVDSVYQIISFGRLEVSLAKWL